MSRPSIEVEHLAKRYLIGGHKELQYKTIREGVEAYRKVTLQDIAAVLKKYPLTENTTVAVGPLTELKVE